MYDYVEEKWTQILSIINSRIFFPSINKFCVVPHRHNIEFEGKLISVLYLHNGYIVFDL